MNRDFSLSIILSEELTTRKKNRISVGYWMNHLKGTLFSKKTILKWNEITFYPVNHCCFNISKTIISTNLTIKFTLKVLRYIETHLYIEYTHRYSIYSQVYRLKGQHSVPGFLLLENIIIIHSVNFTLLDSSSWFLILNLLERIMILNSWFQFHWFNQSNDLTFEFIYILLPFYFIS